MFSEKVNFYKYIQLGSEKIFMSPLHIMYCALCKNGSIFDKGEKKLNYPYFHCDLKVSQEDYMY